MHIVLASKSPRRSELLRLLYSEFSVQAADVDECIAPTDDVAVAVMSLAFQKANICSRTLNDGALIIAADTVVYCDEVFGKPTDSADAKRMLRRLSGHKHQVVTGVALIESQTNNKKVFYQLTDVFMRDLTDGEIDWYISTSEPLDKAGAYGIQGYGARLVDHINGDFYTVMGLPVARLATQIRDFFPTYYPSGTVRR